MTSFFTFLFFFFNDTATTEIYTLSLHDALPILGPRGELVPPRALGRRRILGHDSAFFYVYGRRGHAARPRPSHGTGRHTSREFSPRADALCPSDHPEPDPHLGFRRTDQAAVDQRSLSDRLHVRPYLSHHTMVVAISGPRGFCAARRMDRVALRFPRSRRPVLSPGSHGASSRPRHFSLRLRSRVLHTEFSHQHRVDSGGRLGGPLAHEQ